MAYHYYAPMNTPTTSPARPPSYTLALSSSRAPNGTLTPPAIDLTLHHHPRLCEETRCESSQLKCPPSTTTTPTLGLSSPSSPSQEMSLSLPATRTATPTMTPCTRQSAALSAVTLQSFASDVAVALSFDQRPEEERRRSSMKVSVREKVRWFKRGFKGIFGRKSMRF